MKIAYCGLERIESRYTHQLEDWNRPVFERRGHDFVPIYGTMPAAVEGKIVTGAVLDAHGRTHYSLTQVASLVTLLQQGQFTSSDVIFFEDMFTPGIESLAYIFAQVPENLRPKIYVRCLAQSIDPDDFVIREGMFNFMRPFELMVDAMVAGILVASEEMVAYLRVAGFKAPIYVTGLPFGKTEVQSRVPEIPAWETRPLRVSFAARWDPEKQPDFFMSLVQTVVCADSRVQFEFLTGNATVRSSEPSLVDKAYALQRRLPDNFCVHTGLSKNEYYSHLANSRVLFNCALQDWVSNTVSEADTLGCQTLYPAYRSFPEVFGNDARHLYVPWSVEDAANKLLHLVGNYTQNVGKVSAYQDGTIDRTIDVFEGNSAHFYRDSKTFRLFVTQKKL